MQETFPDSFEMYTIESLQKFAKNPCIISRNGADDRIYDYAEVLRAAKYLCQQFYALGVSQSVSIALRLKDGQTAGSIPLLIAILNHGCHFYPLEHCETALELSDHLTNCGATFLVSNDDPFPQQTHLCKLSAELQIFDEHFFLYSVQNTIRKHNFLKNVCYTIGTSGTTGRPKMVHVPYDCIAPNIYALCSRFQITADDVIFLGTPFTFDPFVVEFFMALSCGAALLITKSALRLAPQKLLNVLWPKKCNAPSATILQMTPSLFRQFGVDAIRDTILAGDSSLRILILGGEEFPKCTEIMKWLGSAANTLNKRIFNIYGIAEVSCWSTIHELQAEEIIMNKNIPIGRPIDDETILRIVDVDEENFDNVQRGELLIGSATRKSYIPEVDDKNNSGNAEDVLYRHTGDLVERNDIGEIFYTGRLNNVVKRMGKRISLDVLEQKIEDLLPNNENDLKVICLWKPLQQSLICCIHQTTKVEDKQLFHEKKRLIMQNLMKHEKPDWIVQIPQLPLNKHGKIDRKKLLEKTNKSEILKPVNIFKDFLLETLAITMEERSYRLSPKRPKLTTSNESLMKSFTDLGGTSFNALSLATEIGQCLTDPTDQRNLLEMLLDPKIAVAEVFTFLENAPTCATNQRSKQFKMESKATSSSVRSLQLLWRIDLLKCVDATPAVDIGNRYVCIGSHAHLLLTVDASSGKEVSRLNLRNRIECEAVFVSSDLALIGCNAGYLYGFNHMSGELRWSLRIGSKIKAKPLVFDTSHAIVGCYDENFNLVSLCLKTQHIEWRRKIGNKPIFSSPILLDSKTALVCTLDGVYERLELCTGNTVWTHRCASPIFSTPAIIDILTFGIAEVGGKVHICELRSGDILQSFSLEGNIFSNITVHRDSSTEVKLIIGCHDHRVYCFSSTHSKEIVSMQMLNFDLQWKTLLESAVYATPMIVHFERENYIMAIATEGTLSVLELSTGSKVATYKLEGEVFSTPCIVRNNEKELRICFGCRDNYFYCFRLN